jgi:hypothetical protein
LKHQSDSFGHTDVLPFAMGNLEVTSTDLFNLINIYIEDRQLTQSRFCCSISVVPAGNSLGYSRNCLVGWLAGMLVSHEIIKTQ